MTPKPALIWITQSLLGLLGAGAVYFAGYMDGGISRIILAACGLLHLGVAAGLQLRQSWARWAAVVILAMTTFGSLLSAANKSGGDAALQRAVVVLICLPLTWLLAFGQPCRQYFAARESKDSVS